MSYISYSKICTCHGATWRIYSKKCGFYTKMVKQMIGQVLAMLSHHHKVFLLRFDLHQQENPLNNKRISVFIRQLFGRIETGYKVKRIGYLWVREQEQSDNPHYHFAILLDGSKVQHPYYLLKMVKEVWEFMDGTAWIPSNCYYRIKRDDFNAVQLVVLRVSYFAKGRGKDSGGATRKNYGTSRIAFA